MKIPIALFLLIKSVPAIRLATREPATNGTEAAEAALEKMREEDMKTIHHSVVASGVDAATVQEALSSYVQRRGVPLGSGGVSVLTDVADIEKTWKALPPGAIAVVPVNGTNQEKVMELAWQAMYKLNSYEYFEAFTGLPSEVMGLPDLQFVSFLPGSIVLEKAGSDGNDMKEIYKQGRFYVLAEPTHTDKVDSVHYYQLLYHRHLDNLPEDRVGIFLEIGLGCTMAYGAGSSARVWPKLLPALRTHFVEFNKECVEKWMPDMKAIGVEKVHVGSQVDPMLLANITREAQATLGGMQVVVDDGSHEAHHIAGSFRILFPALARQGLYFVEDMMYTSWGTSYRQSVASKAQPTEGTPIALAVLLGSAAAGVDTGPTLYPESSWSSNILASYAPLVDSVECSPGICMFRKK